MAKRRQRDDERKENRKRFAPLAEACQVLGREVVHLAACLDELQESVKQTDLDGAINDSIPLLESIRNSETYFFNLYGELQKLNWNQ